MVSMQQTIRICTIMMLLLNAKTLSQSQLIEKWSNIKIVPEEARYFVNIVNTFVQRLSTIIILISSRFSLDPDMRIVAGKTGTPEEPP